MAKDIKEFLRKYPDVDIEIPQFHIGKTSGGWKPLFNSNPLYSSVKEIRDFYLRNPEFEIVDEYGEVYTWNEFTERVLKFGENNKTHIGQDVGTAQYWLDEEGYEL